MYRSAEFSRDNINHNLSTINKAKVTRQLARAPLLALLAGLMACDQTVDVSLKAGAISSRLDFQIIQHRNGDQPVRLLQWVLVQRCKSHGNPPLWVINSRGHNSITDFTYGRAPSGWSTYKAAERLTPGCYYVVATGPTVSGSSFFNVDSAGQVLPKN